MLNSFLVKVLMVIYIYMIIQIKVWNITITVLFYQNIHIPETIEETQVAFYITTIVLCTIIRLCRCVGFKPLV